MLFVHFFACGILSISKNMLHIIWQGTLQKDFFPCNRVLKPQRCAVQCLPVQNAAVTVIQAVT